MQLYYQYNLVFLHFEKLNFNISVFIFIDFFVKPLIV